MNVLILSDKIKPEKQLLNLNIIAVTTTEELIRQQEAFHPCLMLLDPLLLDLQSLSDLPEYFKNIPIVFLLDSKISADYSALFSLFQPFRSITKSALSDNFDKLTENLATEAQALLLRGLQSSFYQALSEKNVQYPARSSCFRQLAVANQLYLQDLLTRFSLSDIYVVCLCSSGLFSNKHHELLQQFVASHPALLLSVPFDNDFVILASNPDTDSFTQLLQGFQKISSSMEYSVGFSWHLPVNEKMNISSAFHQAKLATELNFYSKAEIVPWTASLFSQNLDLKVIISYEKELTNAILMGYNESELLYTLNEYIDYFRSNRILPSLVCDSVYRFLNSLDRVFKFIDPLCSIDLSQITLADVCAEGTLDKLHATLAEMLTDFLRKGEHYTQTSDHLLLEIQSWIDNHLDQPISLATIEQEFLVNKFVFCRQFKKFTGQTFNKYLKNVRMQNALTLLKNTDIKIYEIAHRLAFRDESYFSSAFKKEFGISPTEYRSQN